MKHTENTKAKLQDLEKEVNRVSEATIHLQQQLIIKEHMSFVGGNGRLCICPNSEGYDISLSGKSIQRQMYGFMKGLCGKECDGFKQLNRKKGKQDQPYWRVKDFGLVCQATLQYAKSGK